MVVSVTGIVINVIMALIIFFLIVIGSAFNNELRTCETKQSPFCYTIHCPCDATVEGQSVPPCFGYTKMPAGPPGQWICSNAVLTIVDDSGNIV